MNRRCVSIVTVIVLSTIMFSGVNAHSKIDNKDSARLFVQKFYDWYGKVYDRQRRHITAQDEIIKRNPQYLDKKLLDALLADEKAWARHPRAIIGLDFDSFTNTLDTRKGYQTGLVTQKADKFFVDVHDIRGGQSVKEVMAANVILTAEVAYINRHWRFVDFVYPRPYALDSNGGTLLGILDSLHRDRIKQKFE